jgi:hypothetical protein
MVSETADLSIQYGASLFQDKLVFIHEYIHMDGLDISPLLCCLLRTRQGHEICFFQKPQI